MRAHDVRHLCVCTSCGKPGDDREMIYEVLSGFHVHGYCAIGWLGMDRLLSLPKDERAKFRLCDIGVDVMKKLVELAESEGH